jgi:hypothetical protein
MKQSIFNNRKEVIRCLMVQQRGRTIPFGRLAADQAYFKAISDADIGISSFRQR